jgi:peroxiredoxin
LAHTNARVDSNVAKARTPKDTMTATALEAPELAVNCWFNTDRPLNLAALRGRVVALVAFQALCPQSVAVAIPQARRIHETFEPSDVAVIGLHATFEHHEAYSQATVKAFIQEYRLKFPIALDSANTAGPIPATMERYNMRGTPSLVLIDRQGLIRKHAFGAAEDLRIGAEIGALAAEPVVRAAQSSAA